MTVTRALTKPALATSSPAPIRAGSNQDSHEWSQLVGGFRLGYVGDLTSLYTENEVDLVQAEDSIFCFATIVTHLDDFGIEAADGFDEVRLSLHDLTNVFVDAWYLVRTG